MKAAEIIKLAMGDKLYKYVTFKGIFTYIVIGIRQYKEGDQYEIECQDCSDHPKCQLLVLQRDDQPFFSYVRMLNNDDEDDTPQHYWHDDSDKHPYFNDKKKCKTYAGKQILKREEDLIEKLRKDIKAVETRITEIKIWIDK